MKNLTGLRAFVITVAALSQDKATHYVRVSARELNRPQPFWRASFMYEPSPYEPPRFPVEATPAEIVKSDDVLKLETQRNNGAGWFTAIAGFSLVNQAILLFNGGISFVIGLGITQVLVGICHGLSEKVDSNTALVAWIICGAGTLLFAGMFFGLAALAKKGHLWAFVVGMVIYALDGLIFLLFQDWLPFGFHVYALIMIFNGLSAQWKLSKLQ